MNARRRRMNTIEEKTKQRRILAKNYGNKCEKKK